MLRAYQEREREHGWFLKEGKREVDPDEEVGGCPHGPVVIEMVKSGAEKNRGSYKWGVGVKELPQAPLEEEWEVNDKVQALTTLLFNPSVWLSAHYKMFTGEKTPGYYQLSKRILLTVSS